MRKLLLSPLWLTGAIIAPVGRQRIQGAIIGAIALTALTGYVNAENARLPVTPEYIAALDAAQIENGTLWDEPVDLAPLDSADAAPAFIPPIPERKPDVSELGYSGPDRDAMNQLFAEVTR